LKVRYTLPALADLEAILDYVTERSPQGAHRIKTRIRAVEQLLAQYPLTGARTRHPWLRRIRISAYPYVIFYEAADGEVIVHAVRHAARAPSTMPGSG
jgi:toxin ParE1/3/4